MLVVWGAFLGVLHDAKETRLQTRGNGWNTVSRVLFRKRELTEFRGKLFEFSLPGTGRGLQIH